MLLPDIETWKRLTDNGKIGSGTVEWQRLDNAYQAFYLNQRDSRLRQECEDALDAFLAFKHNNTTRNKRGALSALKATLTTKPELLTHSTLYAAREMRKDEEIAILNILGRIEFGLNERNSMARHVRLHKAVYDASSSISELIGMEDSYRNVVEGLNTVRQLPVPNDPRILQTANQLNSQFHVTEVLTQVGGAAVNAFEFLSDLSAATALLGPIVTGGEIVHNLYKIVNNKLDFNNNNACRHLARKGDVQFSIDILNDTLMKLNDSLAIDTVRSAVDLGAYFAIPVTGGLSAVISGVVNGIVDVLTEISETREVLKTVERVNHDIKTYRSTKEFLDLMLDVPELAAYFLCNVNTNTFLSYCSFQINQPFFMLIVEENKNKIDRIINVARNIIENSPYKVLHFDRVEKEVAESRLREMQKLWNESKEIMELSAKINDLQRKKQKQAEELKRKQRRLAAWQLLEVKAKETVAEYEKETSADVTGAARIFLGVLRSDASLAAIEALKAELAGSYGPDAKLDRILQLMEFLLGRWREPNRQGVVMLKAGSRLQMKLTGKFNEFLREYPEFDRSRQP
jgi:hypothetical protein